MSTLLPCRRCTTLGRGYVRYVRIIYIVPGPICPTLCTTVLFVVCRLMFLMSLFLRKGLTSQKCVPLQRCRRLPQHKAVTLAKCPLAGSRKVGCPQLYYTLGLSMLSVSCRCVLRGITLEQFGR